MDTIVINKMIDIIAPSIRTMPENRYYYGVVVPYICEFKRWTKEKTHQWVKDTWHIETTTGLTTIEFEALMSSIREHTSEFWGLEIPLPNN